MKRPCPLSFARALTFGSVLLGPTTALAGGFEIPDTGARAVGRGGAQVVGAQDLTAIHYNPALLARQRGTAVMYHHNLMFHDTTFQRAPLGEGLPNPEAAWGADAGTTLPLAKNRQKVFPLGLFAAVASDFGLENWRFAAAVYGPSAIGKHDYPDYGPQSFQITKMDILMAYYTLGAAWKFKDVFGIGATVQYVDLIQLKYALVTDSTAAEDLNPIPAENSTQLVTELDLKDRTAATAQLGIWYRPHRRVELGISSRVVPVFLKAEGGVNTDKEEVLSDEMRVSMPMTLPAIVRGGIRYLHPRRDQDGDRFDLELDVVWENWSVFDAYDLTLVGRINGQPIGVQQGMTDDGQPIGRLRIAKNWKDTVSVRLGSDVQALPPYLTVRAGGFFETAAAPNAYSHLDFPTFMRGGVGLGFSAGARGVYFTAGYMHVFQETRTVTELTGKVFQERPIAQCPDRCMGYSGVPANAGRFESSFDLFSVGLDIDFRTLLGDRRGKRKAKDAAAPTAPTPTVTPSSQPTAPAEPTTIEDSSTVGEEPAQAGPIEPAPAEPASTEPALDETEPTTAEPTEPG